MDIGENEDPPVSEGRRLRKRPPSATAAVKTTPKASVKRTPNVPIIAQPDNNVIEIIDPLREEKTAPGIIEQKPPVIEEQSIGTPKSARGRKKKVIMPLESIEDIKAEPTRWLKLPATEMKSLIKTFWGPGPYPCFAITKKKCGTFSTVDEALKHNKKCIQPMYMTYKDRLPLYHALPEETKKRYVREMIAERKEITCHTCGKTSVHAYGMVYHLDRCGVAVDKKPWKCWRCGFEATAGESKEHLKLCKANKDTEFTEEGDQSSDEAEMDTEDDFGMNVPKIEGGEITPTHSSRAARRRTTTKPSVSTGVLPPESSRVRVSNTGQPRYKFRRAECSRLVADLSGWKDYKSKVEESVQRWKEEHMQPLPTALTSAYNDLCIPEEIPTSSMDKSSVGFHFRDNTLAYVSSEKLPDDLKALKIFESTSKVADKNSLGNWITIAYAGGPIHSMKFAPNRFSEDDEVLMTVSYSDDETLLPGNWKDCTGVVNFWIVQLGKEIEEPSAIRQWFSLETKYGAILSACWLDVPRLEKDESLIGFSALSTGQGSILIYRIDSSSVPFDSDKPLKIAPKPLLILRQEPPPPSDDDDVQELKYLPPITRIDWSAFKNSRYVAGISAVGSVVIWDLEGDLNSPTVLFNNSWASPACDLCFSKDYELVVAFREKCVRVYDLRTWALLLEENTVRTAGCKVASCPRALSGFVTYQSEYFNTNVNDAPSTGIHYVGSDNVAKGYFVVPLANRHEMQMWDANINSATAIIATCGVDGQLLLSGHGLVVPRLAKIDSHFSIIRESMLLSKRRVEEPNPSGDVKLLDGLFTHQSICEKTWLEISLKPKKGAKNIAYSSLELRTESLNVVATNSCNKKAIVVTGGQAGLLFIRPCRLDLEGNTMDPLDLITTLTTPSNRNNLKNKTLKGPRGRPVKKKEEPAKDDTPKEEDPSKKEELPKTKETSKEKKKPASKKQSRPPPQKKTRPSRTSKGK